LIKGNITSNEENEDSRWEQTLEALESIRRGEFMDESVVNVWLSSWATPPLQNT